MKTLIEIMTNVYPDPLRTYAMRDEKDGVIYYKWCEQRTPEEKESLYELILDTKGNKATVKRSGNIKSEMEFRAERRLSEEYILSTGLFLSRSIPSI